MFFANKIRFHVMFFQVDISLATMTIFNLVIAVYNIQDILSDMHAAETREQHAKITANK